MTACHLFVQREAAYLLSDTACYVPDGTITHFQPKVLELVNAIAEPAVIGFTGNCFPQDVLPLLERLAPSSATELLGMLPDLVREGERVAAERMPAGQRPFVCLKVAHWNRQYGRADGHVIVNHCDEGYVHPEDATTPYVTKRVGWSTSFSGDHPWHGRDLKERALFNVEREAAAMLRFERGAPRDANNPHVVTGGQGLLTRVALGATTTSVVCSWPEDRAGMQIAA